MESSKCQSYSKLQQSSTIMLIWRCDLHSNFTRPIFLHHLTVTTETQVTCHAAFCFISPPGSSILWWSTCGWPGSTAHYSRISVNMRTILLGSYSPINWSNNVSTSNFLKPISLAYDRKHFRHMLQPYLRIVPCLSTHSNIWALCPVKSPRRYHLMEYNMDHLQAWFLAIEYSAI